MTDFSDYIVYVDESGDHGLASIDENYPVFVLAFCIFNKKDYLEAPVPALQSFKFAHFGHDQVILHETDIRKDRKAFSFLKNPERKRAFISELTEMVAQTPFTLIGSVIKKEAYRRRYAAPDNPYHVALKFGLERLGFFLRRQGDANRLTHVVVEKRGKREDNELELEFRRICDGGNFDGRALPFELVFSDKKSNSAGLQLADMVARPIGLSVLRPQQVNRAYQVLEPKFYRDSQGRRDGRGLKCFP